eukprot:m.41791 g.41791  ORF g.41791 m.41791 type:complete len:68 (-) comp14980_c0_seq1:202-405(-)
MFVKAHSELSGELVFCWCEATGARMASLHFRGGWASTRVEWIDIRSHVATTFRALQCNDRYKVVVFH